MRIVLYGCGCQQAAWAAVSPERHVADSFSSSLTMAVESFIWQNPGVAKAASNTNKRILFMRSYLMD
jgi:hypothetical protein